MERTEGIPILLLILLPIATAIVAAFLGYYLRGVVMRNVLQAATEAAAQQLKRTSERRKEILLEAKEESLKLKAATDEEIRNDRRDLRRTEKKLSISAEKFKGRTNKLDREQAKAQQLLQSKLADVDKEIQAVKAQREEHINLLSQVAVLTKDEARSMILEKEEENARFELARRYRTLEHQTREDVEQNARFLLAETMQRLAADVVSEHTVSSVRLPDVEMKGRLIGKEGRNIRAIEAATGTDILIEDDSQSITISCFDPIRREVSRVALERLIKDGRIQPARIEETVAKAQKTIDEEITKAGNEASFEVGVKNLPREVITLIGRLKYRYSFAENVLRHSIEVGLLAGMMAAEIGADVRLCKTAGFLHDIGKALTHEVEGPHAIIGAEVLRKHKLPKEVCIAVEQHHDVEMTIVPSFIVAAADAISAARPGARKDTDERYLERIKALEDVARGFKGVEKCYAIRAGRELRVLVSPNGVDDSQATLMSRDIVKEIETNLEFPGQIKVVVIREHRSVAVAN